MKFASRCERARKIPRLARRNDGDDQWRAPRGARWHRGFGAARTSGNAARARRHRTQSEYLAAGAIGTRRRCSRTTASRSCTLSAEVSGSGSSGRFDGGVRCHDFSRGIVVAIDAPLGYASFFYHCFPSGRNFPEIFPREPAVDGEGATRFSEHRHQLAAIEFVRHFDGVVGEHAEIELPALAHLFGAAK